MSDQPKNISQNPKIPPARRPTVNSVTTINEDGSHRFLHPADVHGWFTRWRRHSGLALIVFYVMLPWIQVRGYPAVFLDIAGSRFHFFGFTLAAQDVWLLFFGVTGLGFALFFLTALFGRLWCGWSCPHTVYLDHVYRRIERMIDGDAVQRRQLDQAPLSAGKIARRLLKHGLYLGASLIITHIFLSYFVSLPEVWHMMGQAPGEHWGKFLFVFIAAGILYFNFAWFREQLCIVICPYGRLQSALTDDHSLVIGYDTQRGEPRGKLRAEDRGPKTENGGPQAQAAFVGPSSVLGPPSSGPVAASESTLSSDASAATPRVQQSENGGPQAQAALVSPSSGLSPRSSGALGDCIDCNRCVQVCPTGIDIRHGLQMECVGCSACIDACDEVMVKVQRPQGLIRYDSLVGFAGGKIRWIRPRTIVYGILLLVGLAVAIFAFSTVKPASFMIMRMSGAAYFVSADDVRNQFMVRLLNKRNEPSTFTLTLSDLPAGTTQNGFASSVVLGPMAEQVSPFVLRIERKNFTGPFKFTIHVQDQSRAFTLSRQVEFLGPDARLLQEEDNEKGIKR